MPLIPKITTYNTQIIPTMYQEVFQQVGKILTFLFMDQLEKIASWIMKRKIVEDYLPYQVINN